MNSSKANPASATSLARILVVEDERIVADDLAATLEELGYAIAGTVTSGEAAIERTVEAKPHLIFMDIRLSGKMDGIEAAQAIKNMMDIPIIYLTAHSDDPTLVRARSTSPFGYILKPFKALELRCAIEIALHKHDIEERLRQGERWLTATLKSIAEQVVMTDAEERSQ